MAKASSSGGISSFSRRTALKTLGLSATSLALAGCGVTFESPASLAFEGSDPGLNRKIVLEMYNIWGGDR